MRGRAHAAASRIGPLLLLFFLAACTVPSASRPRGAALIPPPIPHELIAAPTATYTLVPTFTSTPDQPALPSPEATPTLLPSPTATSTPLPAPTATPVVTPAMPTLAEMNRRYGPCAEVPVLMYHHVQSYQQALAEGNEAFTITTVRFRQQMTYLVSQGYTTIRMQDLNAFFDEGQALPSRPVLLTFDDGYDDFASDVLPILEELDMQATVFVPVGLIGQPGQLTWEQIDQIAAGAGRTEILFANHTWSHTNVGYGPEAARWEISTADAELAGRGLNQPRTFCYPYGLVSGYAQEILADMGYGLAFTTDPGSILCRGQRLALPRIRVGAGPLEAYGL